MPTIMLALGFLAAFPGPAALTPAAILASADAPAVRLAIVGTDTLTTEDLDAEITATLSSAKGAKVPALDPDAVLRRLIQNRLFEQEGYRIEADRTPIVRNQIHEFILLKSVQALLDSVSAPRPNAAKEAPDRLVGQVGMLRRYSHILVKDPKVAAALQESLVAGLSFSDLARRNSLDGTAVQGGDLGWAAEGVYVQAFEAAGSRLSLNEISGPVETQFGWHLIQLTGSRADTLKSEAMAQALIQARESERRSAVVAAFVDSLKAAYQVMTNDSLLATLDYASSDPAVQQELQSSTAELAVLPNGKLTVRGLARNIRFQYFHGLADRPDAAQIRDRMFHEWVAEGLLRHEAKKRGFDHKPDLLAKARREERRLIREEVLKHVLEVEFQPTEEEIRRHYEANSEDFIPAPRIKVQSVLARDAEIARKLRAELDAGSGLKWLARQHAAEVDSTPPFPADWIPPDMLGLDKNEPIVEGTPIGPLELPGGWALAQVTVVEKPVVPPIESCRDQVLQSMKSARYRQAIEEALSRLEAATEIHIDDGARTLVADRIERLHARRPEGGKP